MRKFGIVSKHTLRFKKRRVVNAEWDSWREYEITPKFENSSQNCIMAHNINYRIQFRWGDRRYMVRPEDGCRLTRQEIRSLLS